MEYKLKKSLYIIAKTISAKIQNEMCKNHTHAQNIKEQLIDG